MTPAKYLEILFDLGESTCFGAHKKATKVSDAFIIPSFDPVFVCINALHPTKDLKPELEYHHADFPRRANANVVSYRTMLVESDKLGLQDYAALISKLGMPYSTRVFSGRISYHDTISLETPLASRSEYDHLVSRVYKALGGKAVVDTSCRKPANFSRFPGTLREDTGKVQSLIEVRKRVPNAELEEWLLRMGVPKESCMAPVYEIPTAPTGEFHKVIANPAVRNFLMMGAGKGERHESLFASACELYRCGYTLDQAEAKLMQISLSIGLERSEIIRHIKNAYREAAMSISDDAV